jgi:signal transduction histidine kinase/ligand-binding sensor domain-containing protein
MVIGHGGWKRASIILFALTLARVNWAQEAYSHRLWQAADGLPSDVVQAFAETPDHAMWIGTTDGLVRFDGSRFRYYRRENTPALGADSVFCLTVTRDGALWIGVEGGGLVRYHDDHFRKFTALDGLSNNVVRAIFEDRDGLLWVGTDQGLFQLHGERLVRVDATNLIPELSVHVITQARDGAMWVGGSSLLRILAGKTQVYRIPIRRQSQRIKSILQTTDGTIWVGAVSGLYRVAGDRLEPVTRIRRTVRVLRQTHDGTLWIGSIGSGLYSIRSKGEPVLFAGGPPSKSILNLYEDREGNLWIGSQIGMERLSRSAMSLLPLPGSPDADFGSVFVDRDGSIWACSTSLYRERDGVMRKEVLPGLQGVTIRNLLRAADGSLWVGTEGWGVFRFSASALEHYTTAQGLSNDFIRVMLQDRDGSLWVGTDGELNHIVARHVTILHIPSHVSVMALLQDRNGDLWAGTFSGLFKLHQGHWVRTPLTAALRDTTIWALHQDADGTIWVGTNRGLYRENGNTVTAVTTAQGLPSHFVGQILEDKKGGLWVNGLGEVAHLSIAELRALAEGRLSRISPLIYPVSQELGSAEIYNGIQPSGAFTPDGELLYPSNKGLVRIQPELQMAGPAFPIIIQSITVDGRAVPVGAEITLGASTSRTEITFAPALLGPQERIWMRYRLDGFDTEWQDAGSHRAAVYTSLPAGRYRFEVQAFESGVESPVAELTLAVHRLAPFYVRPWFLLLLLGLVVAIVFLLHFLRLRRMRERFAAVLEERTRVAREMHDTVIQGCSTVSVLLEASDSLQGDQHAATELTGLARRQIQNTIREARQAILDLRQTSTDEENLVDGLRQITEDASREFAQNVGLVITGNPPSLARSCAYQLLMVTREALHNALIHAHATRVEVQLKHDVRTITIFVKDNGRGLPPELASGSEIGHFGLQGMRERMMHLGGSLEIESRPSSGTVVTVRVTDPGRTDAKNGQSHE